MTDYTKGVARLLASQTTRRGFLAGLARGAVTLGLGACFALSGERAAQAAARDCTSIRSPCGGAKCSRDTADYFGETICVND
ncbi:MAG TPA: hypothetical protein VGS41_15555, partial [Chthonomonadales bacterium]|nr:hypothetical protein [Chthonomonadales bacterium]